MSDTVNVLPTYPSALLRLAAKDCEDILGNPKYKVNMREWHSPNMDERGVCSVCLAGSVIAGTLKAEPDRYLNPALYEHVEGRNSTPQVSANRHLLRAIDRARESQWIGFTRQMNCARRLLGLTPLPTGMPLALRRLPVNNFGPLVNDPERIPWLLAEVRKWAQIWEDEGW